MTAGPGGTDRGRCVCRHRGARQHSDYAQKCAVVPHVTESYLSSDGLSGVTVYLEEFGQSGVEWCIRELLSLEKSSSFLCVPVWPLSYISF